MQPERRATLKDVSREAGVSLYTASRALTGHHDVAEPTKLRVREAAARLGYVANQHARHLKGLTSKVIGVLAASKANQYYATLVSGLEEAVGPSGYSCFVADAVVNGIYLPENEDRIVESLIQQRVSAVVVAYPIDEKNLSLLASWDIPVLFVDCPPAKPGSNHASVSIDNFSAALAMGDHLAELGYRHWCFVGHARNWSTRTPRQQGFEAAAAKCGAQLTIVEGGNDADIARAGMTALLADLAPPDRPHVLFASNTVLLKGSLLALRDFGVKVPEDMAVTAFDEFDWAALVDPPMTVIDQHIDLIGRTAGERLLELLGHTTSGAGRRDILIAHTLRVRESCGARLAPAYRAGGAKMAEKLLEER